MEDGKQRYSKWVRAATDQDRKAECHPERRHYANGLCNKCYDAERHNKRYWGDADRRKREIEKAQAYYKVHKERIHWREMFRIFGITREQYEALLEKQKGLCAVCGGPPKDLRRGNYFTVDHDHNCCKGKKSCGKCIRGLLCITCNAGLGQFNDNVELLKKAIVYLQGG